MPESSHKFLLLSLVFLFLISSCITRPEPIETPVHTQISVDPSPVVTLTPTPEPPRLLTVCMGREPASLFLYGDSSVASRSLREAIYDGPFDILGFEVSPVILEKVPSLADGDARLEPVQVERGDLIVDAQGQLGNLGEGVVYMPSGCSDASCAQSYSGQEPVAMDELVVDFKLRQGLQWSDGAPLTADDSLYSFEVARSLFPRVRSDLISRTQSYLALDPATVAWRGVPGFRDPRYPTNFFTPLPRHAWGSLTPEELLGAEISTRQPLGWGPYRIDEWTPGDHISLSKNPNYFRAAEGLPAFDNLVFRFISDKDEALNALLAGECDYLDETTMLESHSAQLLELQQAGRVSVAFEAGTAWEHVDFGIVSTDPTRPALFQLKETRQAIAMCIDRMQMANELFFGQSQTLDSYVPSIHPLANPEARHYDFDPQAASALLQSIGWLDLDNDPSTPRVSQGVPGVPGGTPFEFNYLTTDEEEKQRAAQIVKDSLAQCGIQVTVEAGDWNELLAPGPDGPVFGRNFSMAQFGWVTALQPPCFLYTSAEIPGPYPEFPKGWGGANASGYSNPDFDRACNQALASLPDIPEHQAAHYQAQAIFAEELPSIPLYLRLKLVAMRPDLCNVVVDPSAESALWNLEAFDYGENCVN